MEEREKGKERRLQIRKRLQRLDRSLIRESHGKTRCTKT
jgi:hypothetical protein